MNTEPMHDVLLQALLTEAHAAAPEEMCGFIIVDPHWTYIPVRNNHKNPTQHFSMEEEMMLELLRANSHNVVGIYHSHPKGTKEPSDNDVELMKLYRNFRFWIVTYNNVYEWRLEDDDPRSVRRDGTAGIPGMAYPLLASAA